jgi:hypothetical protein
MGQTKDPRTEIESPVAGDKFGRVRAQILVTEKTTALQAKSPEVTLLLAISYELRSPLTRARLNT